MGYEAAVVPCADYGAETVRRALREALDAVGGLDWVAPGMTIAVKCNLVGAYKPEAAATVHPAVAAELCRMLVARGAAVTLGDSPSGPFSAAKLKNIYTVTGMRVVEETGAALNEDFSQETRALPGGVRIQSVPVTAWLFKADCVVDLCKLKTHGLVGFTCGVKNFFGILPGTRKTEFHFQHPRPADFCDMLVDLAELAAPRLTLVDAVVGMEGNGPTAGTPRPIGALIAAKTPYAADLVAARLIGLDERAPTIVAAVRRGLCPGRLEELPLYGDAGALAVPDFQKQPPRDNLKPREKFPGFNRLASACFGTGPRVKKALCVGCGKCGEVCPAGAAKLRGGKAAIDTGKCIRCFCCQEFCPRGAITLHRPLPARLLGRL